MLDLEVAGEYLVVAATLLYIKSRVILPHDQRPPEDEAEEDDPRWELVRQLVEYKKYKDAAFELQQCLAAPGKRPRPGRQRSSPISARTAACPSTRSGFSICFRFSRKCSRAPARTKICAIFSRTASPSATKSSSSSRG